MKTNTFEKLNGAGMKIAIVASRFNQAITDRLLAGCEAGLDAAGVAAADRLALRVPGAFELPQAAELVARRGGYDAIICLGCLIKGETDHDVFIAQAVAGGITDVSREHGLPVVFGVLTVKTREQAEARVEGLAEKNKGYEAAMSAVEMVLVKRELGMGKGE